MIDKTSAAIIIMLLGCSMALMMVSVDIKVKECNKKLIDK